MRHSLPQRTLYFVGCEGDSEQAYLALLNKLAEERGLYIGIHGDRLNPGAGDPLELVKKAIQRLEDRRRRSTKYRYTAVFLDADTREQHSERARQALLMARDADIQLVWQTPNPEAVLLRNLDGCQDLRPDATQSLAELKKRWPEYDKSGISAHRLSLRIGYQQVVQAANVEHELGTFLRRIGLV
jgi:hypothetical protein